jgi:hypothetical protein
MGKRDFSVLDRANLNKILAEHKLTSQGLVDPDNAKKLGQFAGVDALILGTIIHKATKTVSLTAKVITTDTAEIVGAARAEFQTDNTVQELASKPTAEVTASGTPASLQDEKPQVVKTVGDLRVEVQSLRIVNGTQYLLTMTLANQNSKKSIWYGFGEGSGGRGVKGQLTDSGGYECGIDYQSLSGIPVVHQYVVYGNGSGYATMQEIQNPHPRLQSAFELKPGGSTIATMKFVSRSKPAESGVCTLQLEFLIGHDFVPNGGTVETGNLVTKVEAK